MISVFGQRVLYDKDGPVVVVENRGRKEKERAKTNLTFRR